MSRTLAALLGGAAGAVALVGIVVILLWFFFSRKRNTSRTSETGSSDPSVQEGRHRSIELPLTGGGSHPSDSHEARCYMVEELSLATKNFSDINLIGEGKFGEVFKGLLHDGMVVAIKKRISVPSQEFIIEVRYLSSIRHRNLVSLLGYCQENGLQMLIYEYIPNGSIASHLYGAGQVSSEKLEFKHRLPIAIGAAKGLAHLHALSPPLIHKNFKTANVLVDENFITKVADAGLRNFLGRADAVGPSSRMAADNIFLAPEVKEFGRFSERSDVYSFGVFLLELVSGRQAMHSQSSDGRSLVEWAQSIGDLNNISTIIDQRLGGSFTAEGMKELILLTIRCIDPSSQRRPNMHYAVSELERILDKEVSLTTVMGGGTPDVALGSHLFTSSR